MSAIILLVSSSSYVTGHEGGGAQGASTAQVTNALNVEGGDFHATAATRSQAGECQWLAATSCSTALTRNDWYYEFPPVLSKDVQVNQNFTVTVGWDEGTGLTQMGSLYFALPSGGRPFRRCSSCSTRGKIRFQFNSQSSSLSPNVSSCE